VGRHPWLNPVDVRWVKPGGRRDRTFLFFYFFIFISFLWSAQVAPRRSAESPARKRKKIKINFFCFYFLLAGGKKKQI
jgi:hypothetical protein